MSSAPGQDPVRAAFELYGLSPSEFTAARDARARHARTEGDRELAAVVSALRRPTWAAWAVNELARRHPGEVGELADLGDELRRAQAGATGEVLRALAGRRQEILAAVTRLTLAGAGDRGHPLSDAVAQQVEQTLAAAMADPVAAEQVRAGTLATHLSYVGFGSATDWADAEVTPEREPGADARPAGRPGAGTQRQAEPANDPGGRRAARAAAQARRDEAERMAESARQADAEAGAAQAEALRARSATADARASHDRSHADLARIRRQLAQARDTLTDALARERELTRRATRASRAAQTARARAAAAEAAAGTMQDEDAGGATEGRGRPADDPHGPAGRQRPPPLI